MEDCAIYKLPDEIFDLIFFNVRFEDFWALFLTCKKIYTLSRNFDIWKYWINRDFPTYYEKYVKNITDKNSVRQHVIDTVPKIDSIFIRLNKTLKEFDSQINELRKIIDSITDTKLYIPESVENVTYEIDQYQEEIGRYCGNTATSESLVDRIDIDPIALYQQFLNESSIVPCIATLDKGRRRGELCGESSVPRKKYCQGCINTNKNLVMMPVKNTLSTFPFNMTPEPKKLQVKHFSEGKYVTITKPHFVFDTKSMCLFGINDEGTDIREATEEEKKIAREYGFHVY